MNGREKRRNKEGHNIKEIAEQLSLLFIIDTMSGVQIYNFVIILHSYAGSFYCKLTYDKS